MERSEIAWLVPGMLREAEFLLACKGVLKKLADVMEGPLLLIYQRSWDSEEVPADWKVANIILILKMV